MAQISIAQALLHSRRLTASSESPQLDVQLLLAHVLHKPFSYLFTWPEKYLTSQEQAAFEKLLAQRCVGEPIAYLLGYQDFWSLRLKVSKDTLIPRPDTELLVELVLGLGLPVANKAQGLQFKDQPAAGITVLDLGTGTGAIALALASEQPNWSFFASDYLPAAAALAESNRCQLRLDNVEITTGSWFEPHRGKRFNVIVSNPPYIEEQDRHLAEGDVRFEPLSALTSADHGLQDIKLIIQQAPDYLLEHGCLLLEHGYNQGPQVRDLFAKRGFAAVRTEQDLAANDRVTLGVWAGCEPR
ncbi:MAG: hypothetical protein OFPII_19590 [Osedax symbiont Rs1]|nr:MAG: hypothetical protein OFPII_19590 [Osedax symbiont Rs1]